MSTKSNTPAAELARRAQRNAGGGSVDAPGSAPWNVRRASHLPYRSGPVAGVTGGRQDRVPLSVNSGSFIIPADIPAALGQGNSNAGMHVLAQMFPQPVRSRRRDFADGGEVGSPTPIMASDGEYVISPEQVAAVANGNLDKGH